ncbi:MAG: BACON domain-containing protein [Alistipes sp.]|nr:BACON domain-containing protein [Alistipes sp.]
MTKFLRAGVALIVMLSATIALSSCEKEPSAPVIKVAQNTVDILSVAGEHSVEYTIQNPVVGGRLDAVTDCAWITEVDATYEKVKFEVEANYDEKGRSGEIELFYDGAAKVVLTINQAGAVSELNGHKFVDLGLSVKWATCNMGATEKGEAGDYYMWADLVNRKSEDYSTDNYPYFSVQQVQGKDKNGELMFDEDGNPVMTDIWVYEDIGADISGNVQYDIARKEWGSTWRLPTQEEVQELIANCTFVWTRYKSINGMEITSKINGMKMFMPAVGFYLGSGVCDYYDRNGSYWTASAYTGESVGYAHYMIMTSGKGFRLDYTAYIKAMPIRPVTE